MTYLKSQNVSIGTVKNDINCESLVKAFRQEFNDIAWLSVYLDGTDLKIFIKENISMNTIVPNNLESNDIVAKKDGIIADIVTRSGTPMVKKGDYVKKDDVLVKGTISVINDNKEVISENYVNADGDIEAETLIEYLDTIESSHFVKIYDDKSYYRMIFKIGNNLLELKGGNRGLENYEEMHVINYDFVQIFELHPYHLQEKVYTMHEREVILENNFELFCRELINDGITILDNNLNILHESSKSNASCRLKVKESIGVKRKIIDLSSENMLQ